MRSENSFTILVIEDDNDLSDLLSTLLRRQGYVVRSARTAAEGLVEAEDPIISLVLLDVMLPGMNGFDVCLKIKERRPRLPVIILSVHNKPIDIVTGLDSGADDYITKPFTNSVLLARIRAALRISATETTGTDQTSAEQTGKRISDALLTVAQPLGGLLDLQTIADTVVEKTGTVLNFEHRALCSWREDTKDLIREQTSFSNTTVKDVLQSLGPRWDQALYKELLVRQELMVTEEPRPAPHIIRTIHTRHGSYVMLGTPIMSQGKLLGALILLRGPRSTFNSYELDVITGITCQAGIAIDHARSWSNLEKRVNADSEQLRLASELLPHISHELRTPVAAIKGFITTLLSNHRYWDDQACETFLENANQSVDQLSRLVENVLEMGRVDKGLQLYKRPTQLAMLVQRVLHDLSFQSNCCEFANEVPEDLPMILSDPLRIARVLRNLLENSVKFSPRGGKIRLFARLTEQGVEIGVEDQGIGIPPEHLPHIFERFYQVGQAEVHKEGIGLGLHIARELIQAHDGKIWAESELGNGTTVYFVLPLNDLAPMQEQPVTDSQSTKLALAARSHESHQANGRSNGKNRSRILIVEDDPQMRRSLETSLEAEGFEILTTSQGGQAVDSVQADEPDLVLLDLGLPDVDGFTVCERVRRISDVPIIIITGRKTESAKVHGLALGADDYLAKPFSNRELLARVQAILRRTQVSDKDEPPNRLRFNGLEIDPIQNQVKTPYGPINLTPTEHRLLYYLASNPNRILTHQQLLSKVWGYECSHQPEYLWVNISRLRKKIEPDPNQPRYILTEPGVGYRFNEPSQAH